MYREILFLIGFERGFVIFYGKFKLVKEVVFVVMILEILIENWESVDLNNKVEIIFLIVVLENEGGNIYI